jgi:hypothetical protein
MPVRYLSDPELARLSGWPDEIADVDAVTYVTLSADDLSWLAGFNRQQDRHCRGWAGFPTTSPVARPRHSIGSLRLWPFRRTPRRHC